MTEHLRNIIFISHRTTDRAVANMLLDFLIATGIPRSSVKCSSLPGNDVKEKISPEIREWIERATVNIVILSNDYYNSAYCLNEAGILWYLRDTPVIPIGLPEIDHDDMIGFLNSDYKLRRLDSDTDIAYFYDMALQGVGAKAEKHEVIAVETAKLKERYKEFCSRRYAVSTSGLSEEKLNDIDLWLSEQDIWIDGYHEVKGRDGNIIEKGQYIKGGLVDGISYNIILKVSKHKDQVDYREPTAEELEEFDDGLDFDVWEEKQTESPVKLEQIKDENWNYYECGRYEASFCFSYIYRYVKKLGLEYFYVVDKKVRLEGKIVKPTFTNFRTLESVMAENAPDELDYLRTGIRNYERDDYAEIEVND